MPTVIPGVVSIPNLEKRPTKMVKPVYPPEARQRWMQGTIVLAVVIGKSGEVETIGCDDECCCTSPAILIKSAANAVRQWRWDVLKLNGRPVRVRTTVAVNFVLDETTRPISVCNAIRDPEWFNGRTVNLFGTMKRVGDLKLLGSAECTGAVVVADDADLSRTIKDNNYLALQQGVGSKPASVAVRGMFQLDKSPGELQTQRLILERVLAAPK